MPPQAHQTITFLGPDRIVRFFNLEKGDLVAEFGPGHGYFTLAMARAVGPEGKIFAIDVQKTTIEVIRAKAKGENITNTELIWSDLEQPNGSKLKDGYVDAVLIANCLFQAENKEGIIQEAGRILKQHGRLIIIEWGTAPEVRIGPPQELRLPKRYVTDLVLKQTFTSENEFDAGTHHYGLLFFKK